LGDIRDYDKHTTKNLTPSKEDIEAQWGAIEEEEPDEIDIIMLAEMKNV